MRLPLFVLVFGFVFHSQAQQLVLPGDNPDPSVVKIGQKYWAAGTTSNWFPAFTLYQSGDLVNWKSSGHVFTKLPEWADYYLWAPEITYDNGKVYMYYTAHKKGGNLCIATAVADQPQGPYTDLGPLMCQEDGSIDAFPMRDEHGKLYMIWKEDGNSVKKPTPIWAQEMKEDRTALIGEKKELFRGDAPWEKGLVEGVSIIKKGDYFYAFYAAAACCGKTCNYGTGIARSKKLLGPWVKYPGNPVMATDADWKCPGHGTPVQKNGKYYFLYHAYSTSSGAYGGRQGLLNEFKFTSDGWIEFLNGKNYGTVKHPTRFVDHFAGAKLTDGWHWSVFQDVTYTISKNTLQLDALSSPGGAYIGQSVRSANYNARVAVQTKSTASAGLALIGDDKNIMYAAVKGNRIYVTQLKAGKAEVIAEKTYRASPTVILKVSVQNNTQVSFMYSTDGAKFIPLNDQQLDASYLPPWDRAVRAGLVSKGEPGTSALFREFVINY